MGFFSRWFGGRSSSKEVYEFTPKEEYVESLEFERRIQSAFTNRDQAISWLEDDPLRFCDYCGDRNQPSPTSSREGIGLVTFYKRVPEGARDLRIVLGSYWFVFPASEMKCRSCGKTVIR
ncbi:MAG: hypothetical protein KDD52_01220 [Bdellovibrionales bacterium]|nr:hypothetical protein [Bdellovibrionales bacterium]